MQAGEAFRAMGVAVFVEGAVGAAVRVGDDGAGGETGPFGILDDLFWTVVQGGRQRAHLDRPPATGGDFPDVPGEGTAGDDLDVSSASPGGLSSGMGGSRPPS